MNLGPIPPSSDSEAAQLAQVATLLAARGRGVAQLLALRTEANWAVRREVVSALGALGNLSLAALIQSLLEERDNETRIAATVDALVASSADVELAVTSLLGGPVPVLADVAQILGRRRNRASLPVLALLADNSDDNVAVGAIEALGRIGGRGVVDVLIRAIESRRFFRMFAAIDVLGKSGDPRAIAPLVQLLDNAYCSFEAIRALGRTADRSAIGALARLLVAPGDAQVRAAAAAVADLRQLYAERFGNPLPIDHALRAQAPSGATRRLLRGLSGADNHEQVSIFVVLGALRDPEAIPPLLQALNANPALGSVAANVLKQFAVESDQQLIDALRGGDSLLRETLLPMLSQGSYSEAVATCLLDPTANVRRLACDALARIGDQAVLPNLFTVLADTSAAVVQAAVSAITSLGSSQTLVLASAAAKSESATVRRAALRILAYTGNAETFRIFQTSTQDPDTGVRAAAIQGLALLEIPAAIDWLLTLSDNEDAGVRANAARALGDCPTEPRVGARLIEALMDSNAWVRYYACQSLGKLREETSLQALADRVRDEAGQVRLAAIEALSHFTSAAAFVVLVDAAKSSDLDQKRAALIGLGLSGRIEAVPVLLVEGNTSDAATRLLAVSALANFDTPETLRALHEATADADEGVSSAALAFLGARPGIEATRLLGELLKNSELLERARNALLTPQTQRVAGLSALLHSADDEHAMQISSVLARLNRADATAALFEGLTLPNTAARKAAATTLAAIGSHDAFPVLQRLAQEDADAEVRRLCSLLLAQ